jgi:hypothetical protein
LRLGELRTSAKTPPAISGGTLAVDRAGTVAVVGDSDRDLIYITNLTSSTVRKIPLPPGSEPGRVVLEGTTTAHVALRGTGEVARVDLQAGTVARQVVCSHPRGIGLDEARALLVVACLDGQLVELDAATHREVTRKTDLPNDLRDVIVGPRGVEAVTRFRSAELLRLADDHSVGATQLPRKGSRFNSEAPPSVFDPAGFAPPGSTVLPVNHLALSPTLAWRSLRAANGHVWMLHQQSQDAPVMLARAGGYGSGGCSTITGGKVTQFDAEGNPVNALVFPLRGLTVDAALSRDGAWLALAHAGTYLLSQATLTVYETARMPAVESFAQCTHPNGLGGEQGQTTAVAFDDANVLYAYSREPAQLSIYVAPGSSVLSNGSRLTHKATIALDLSSARDTGHDLFHADVGRGLACASCHAEALDDAHVWDFEKIGARRTQNMRGGLLGTAPFHWDGDMMSISHLVDEVMTRRMGGFNVTGPFATALGTWIDRQPALTLPARDAAAVERGEVLFNAASTQCSTCHSGKNFTNNESRDVGTGQSFQVPGLLGLALRGPYMHSGCAKTLEDRFKPECGGGDKHGRTSDLTLAQIADLVAYLKTL